jgi:L-fuconolactonase
MDDSMAALRRDFLPHHLAAELGASNVAGAVSVQARQSLEETAWLLGFARSHHFILGVVGWAPLADPRLHEILAPLAADRKLVGVRHVIQGEPDDDFILREDFNAGIRALRPLGLRYDILILARHLPQTIRFVDRHPDQVFVLDHIAKPRIRERILSPWRENILELARRPNVYCKLSGLVTEADPADWTPAGLAPYIDTVLEAFGPRRLMFGSDWPVCLLGVTYSRWLAVVLEALSGLSVAERQRICSATAAEAYGLVSV